MTTAGTYPHSSFRPPKSTARKPGHFVAYFCKRRTVVRGALDTGLAAGESSLRRMVRAAHTF